MEQNPELRKLIEIIENNAEDEIRVQAGDILAVFRKGEGLKIFKLNPIEEIPAEEKEERKEGEIITITAPSAGVFYRRPEPDAPPYVEVGSQVNPGDTLGLIEVMKSFGPVVSEVKGEVVEILAEDGKPVEYGQALFLIRKLE